MVRRSLSKLLPMTTAAIVAATVWVSASAHAGVLPNWWVRDALCVHHYEGSWTDSGAPYWGGLQMDYGFQSTYGSWALRRWGTADHWPIRVQLQVAYQAWKTRGWYPWPNTARYCHLL